MKDTNGQAFAYAYFEDKAPTLDLDGMTASMPRSLRSARMASEI